MLLPVNPEPEQSNLLSIEDGSAEPVDPVEPGEPLLSLEDTPPPREWLASPAGSSDDGPDDADNKWLGVEFF